MFRVEYTRDDPMAQSPDEKCSLCDFKFLAKTVCCDTKLCGFHIRNDGEHADQAYYSCWDCETTEPCGDHGYIRVYNGLYCQEHNPMTKCDKCEDYVCDKHLDHKCSVVIPYTPSQPTHPHVP